eukprot:gene6952-10696_t
MIEREIGEEFVRRYYTTYSKNPEDLGSMYSMASMWAHAPPGRNLVFTKGREDIKAKLAQVAAESGNDCKFNIVQADCIPSLNDSIMILVQGVMLTATSARDFAHLFLLGRTADAYYIHNDVMRVCDEEEDDYEEAEEEEEEPEEPEHPEAHPSHDTAAHAAADDDWEQAADDREAAEPPAAGTRPQAAAKPKPAAPAAAAERPRERAEKEAEPAKPRAPPSSWASLVVGRSAAPSGAQGESRKPVRVTGGAMPITSQQQSSVVMMPSDRKGAKGGKGARLVRPGMSAGDRGEAKGEKGYKGGGEKGGKGVKGSRPREEERKKDADVNYTYHSLYVSHLPDDFREGDVDAVFKKFGEIKGKKFQIVWKGHTLNVQERKSPEQRAKDGEKKPQQRPAKPAAKK